MSSKQAQLWKSLQDADFRRQFVDEHVNVGVAFQIRALRNKKNLKQSDLAEMLHLKQPQVSSWENPNYGKYSLKTLKELAKVFDVGLLVRFVPFSTLVERTVGIGRNDVAPASFGEEQKPYAVMVSDAMSVQSAGATNTGGGIVWTVNGETPGFVTGSTVSPGFAVSSVITVVGTVVEQKEPQYA